MERYRVEKPDVIISIDPDIDKSGFACLDVSTREICLSALTFPELIKNCAYIKWRAQNAGKRLKIIVEDGWINSSNWHLMPYFSKSMCCEIGRRTGENHGTGKIIVSYLKDLGYDVDEVRPLRKCWKGKDGKITAEEFKEITGYDKRCNSDMRDAGLLAWVYAGLPIRMKVNKKNSKAE